MKQIRLTKRNYLNWKTYTIAGVGIFLIACGFTYGILKAVNDWYATHELSFNKIVTVEFKKPIEVKRREIPTQEVIRVVEQIPEPQDLETDAEKYIFEKFGIENYKIAIAVAKAESGLREDAIGINTNGTVDIGLFQINSIHYKKDVCALQKVVTVKGNIDCAYEIWKDQKWSPWVAFNNGNFISKLE